MNNQKLADSFTFINCAPPGAMTYDAVEFGALEFKTAFLIKESQSRLNMLPENSMHIEIRSSLIIYDHVALIPLLIQFDNNPSLTYQDWLNYHESDITKQCFNYLITQESLYLLFFTGGILPAKAFTVSNNLQLGFRDYVRHLKNMVPWNTDDFKRMKLKMSRKHPSTLSLWDGLKEAGEK